MKNAAWVSIIVALALTQTGSSAIAGLFGGYSCCPTESCCALRRLLRRQVVLPGADVLPRAAGPRVQDRLRDGLGEAEQRLLQDGVRQRLRAGPVSAAPATSLRRATKTSASRCASPASRPATRTSATPSATGITRRATRTSATRSASRAADVLQGRLLHGVPSVLPDLLQRRLLHGLQAQLPDLLPRRQLHDVQDRTTDLLPRRVLHRLQADRREEDGPRPVRRMANGDGDGSGRARWISASAIPATGNGIRAPAAACITRAAATW